MIRLFGVLCLFVTAMSGALHAEERIALIVGNGSYTHVAPLANPTSDARLMAETLEQVGFTVTTLIDASQAEMKRGISEFGRSIRQAGPETTALFYYAGHAVQSFGNNYLLPVDSAIRDQADLDLYAVEADWLVRQLYTARIRTSIVILDACRNNPFASIQGFADQGLAEMDAPTGSFIAFATAPGRVALDGTGANSPYTTALAKVIRSRSMPIEQVFKTVRVDVLEQTKGAQTPWDYSSLTSDFRFIPETNATPEASAEEWSLWNSVRENSDPSQIQLFLKVYPNSVYRQEAEDLLASLQGERALALIQGNPEQPVVTPPVQSGGGGGDSEVITFTSPLTQGAPHIVGRSIQEIFSTASPMFPPIEGLPEELWKGQNCSNCHKWTKDLLCDQGKFYLTQNGTRSLGKQHPLGGTFKENLSRWAKGGCQ